MIRTPFAGLTALEPGESLSTDGYSFQSRDRMVIDRLLKVGAVTHRHDGHQRLPDPAIAPTASGFASGGIIPASTTLYVGYTWQDTDLGETRCSPVVAITTPAPILTPVDAPTASAQYSGGTLTADRYYYAVTLTDGLGGETEIGPASFADRLPGYASGQVRLAGFTAICATASAAGWRLFRSVGGGNLDFIAEGSQAVDVFVDDGATCADCTVRPPSRNSTNGANHIEVDVPAAIPGASAMNLYVSDDGALPSPALWDQYPASSASRRVVIPSLAFVDGRPPDVATTIGGANPISAYDIERFGERVGILAPGPRDRTASAFVANALAASGQASGMMELGASFHLIAAEASHQARLRLYTRHDRLLADAGRALGVPPGDNAGVIVDRALPSGAAFHFNPQPLGSNLEDGLSNEIPVLVDSLIAASANVSVQLKSQALEWFSSFSSGLLPLIGAPLIQYGVAAADGADGIYYPTATSVDGGEATVDLPSFGPLSCGEATLNVNVTGPAPNFGLILLRDGTPVIGTAAPDQAALVVFEFSGSIWVAVVVQGDVPVFELLDPVPAHMTVMLKCCGGETFWTLSDRDTEATIVTGSYTNPTLMDVTYPVIQAGSADNELVAIGWV